MNKLTASDLSKFNTIRDGRDEKDVGMLSGFVSSSLISEFLRVEALLARAYVYLSDGQDAFALDDLNYARRLAPRNLEVAYLAELIEGRQFVPSCKKASKMNCFKNGKSLEQTRQFFVMFE